jgi:sulfide:quinone oxidoreductase
MATRIVILGAGFGGLTVAIELRAALGPEHEIVVVERNDSYLMGLRKLWILAGLATAEEGRRPVGALAGNGIRLVREQITRIDLAARTVETSGPSLTYDHLVVALGAEGRPDLVPGFREHARNLYDAESVIRASREIAAFSSGRLLVAIAGIPYKCPPAPFEATMLLESAFRARGVREQISLTVTSPQPMSLPIVGKAACSVIETELLFKGIEFFPNKKVQQIEAGRVLYEDGEVPYDLLVGVPPHRCPPVVKQSGLTGEGEWVKVNPQTMETAHPGVWAIGDVTEIMTAVNMPLPKAGVFAEGQGKVVAAAIAARVAGAAPPDSFDGYGYCFLEMGDGVARLVRGHFLAEGGPQVELAMPGPEHAQAKEQFERERLDRWFGTR